jgi:hypothetical protein
MIKNRLGRKIIQRDRIDGRWVYLLEHDNGTPFEKYYMGPGPNRMYAEVRDGMGDFGLTYSLAKKDNIFTLNATDIRKVQV